MSKNVQGYLFVVDTVNVVHLLQTSPVCWGKSLENKQSLAWNIPLSSCLLRLSDRFVLCNMITSPTPHTGHRFDCKEFLIFTKCEHTNSSSRYQMDIIQTVGSTRYSSPWNNEEILEMFINFHSSSFRLKISKTSVCHFPRLKSGQAQVKKTVKRPLVFL